MAKTRADELNEAAELVKSFVEEATANLLNIDALLLRLEEVPLDPGVVDSLFRKIHTIKGGAGFVDGADALSRLSHEFESVLSGIKKQTILPTGEGVILFFACIDLIRGLLQNLGESKEPSSADLEKVDFMIKELAAIRAGSGSQASGEPLRKKATKESGESAPPVRHAEEAATEDDGILVSNEKLDEFMGVAGEMIVLKNYFQMLTASGKTDGDSGLMKRMSEFGKSLNKLTDELQGQIASVRKVTLQTALSKIPRIVKQTSHEVGKNVVLMT